MKFIEEMISKLRLKLIFPSRKIYIKNYEADKLTYQAHVDLDGIRIVISIFGELKSCWRFVPKRYFHFKNYALVLLKKEHING